LEIDNNLIENAIRPSVIGKKNWLFVGHPEAGERSAVIYTLLGKLPAARPQPVRLFEGFIHAPAGGQNHRDQAVHASGVRRGQSDGANGR
jgi:hypothetical protein